MDGGMDGEAMIGSEVVIEIIITITIDITSNTRTSLRTETNLVSEEHRDTMNTVGVDVTMEMEGKNDSKSSIEGSGDTLNDSGKGAIPASSAHIPRKLFGDIMILMGTRSMMDVT